MEFDCDYIDYLGSGSFLLYLLEHSLRWTKDTVIDQGKGHVVPCCLSCAES